VVTILTSATFSGGLLCSSTGLAIANTGLTGTCIKDKTFSTLSTLGSSLGVGPHTTGKSGDLRTGNWFSSGGSNGSVSFSARIRTGFGSNSEITKSSSVSSLKTLSKSFTSGSSTAVFSGIRERGTIRTMLLISRLLVWGFTGRAFMESFSSILGAG